MRTRTLVLAAVGAVALVGAVVLVRHHTRPGRAIERAARTVIDLGGKVERAEDGPVTAVRLSRNHVTNDHLAALEAFPDLSAVHLVGTNVTGDGLRHLRHLRTLRTLDLRVSPVGDDALAELRHFPALETLVLRETRVTDAGLAHLAAVPGLRALDLAGTAVTVTGLRHLKPLAGLERLDLPAGLPPDAVFDGLHEAGRLHLFSQAYTADQQFARSTDEVTGIRLNSLTVSPATLRKLRALPKLTRIELNNGQITDAVFGELIDLGWVHNLTQARAKAIPRPREVAPGQVADQAEFAAYHDRTRWRAGSDAAVRALDLSQSRVTDIGVALLARLPALQMVELGGSDVTAVGVVQAAALPALRDLLATGIALPLPDYRAVRARPGVTVSGIGLEASDEAVRDLRAAGELAMLEGRPFSDCDWSGTADPKARAENARGLVLTGPRVTDAGLRELGDVPGLTGITLAGARVTDDGLRALRSHSGLKRLSLARTPVTDAGLRAVAALTSLEYLNLESTHVTDAGLAELRGLRHLREVNLSDTAVAGPGLRHLGGLDALLVLRTRPADLTDGFLRAAREGGVLHRLAAAAGTGRAGMGRPASPADVTELDLTDAPVTDAGLAELKPLSGLKRLHLARTRVTDAGLPCLADLPLTHLDLGQTAVTDAGLDALAGAATLRDLRAYNTPATEAGARRLRAAVPGIYVELARPNTPAVPTLVGPGRGP